MEDKYIEVLASIITTEEESEGIIQNDTQEARIVTVQQLNDEVLSVDEIEYPPQNIEEEEKNTDAPHQKHSLIQKLKHMLAGSNHSCHEHSSISSIENEDNEPILDDGKRLLEAPACHCSICFNLSKNEEKFKNELPLDVLEHFEYGQTEIIHQKENDEGLVLYIQLETKDFDWIAHKLLPPDDKPELCGCELLFPDTAFFDIEVTAPGRAKDIIKTDQQGFVVAVTQEQKLNMQEIRTGFSLLVRERWKEEGRYVDSDLFAKYKPLFDLKGLFGKKLQEENEDAEKRRTRHRDQVVVRFKKGFGPDGPAKDDHLVVRPLNELEFITLTMKRANDSFWQRIGCIQACGQNKQGLGEHFYVNFKCKNIFKPDDIFDDQLLKYDYHLHDHKYEKEIKAEAERYGLRLRDVFSYQQIQREIEYRMKKDNPKKYCERIAYKIAYYIRYVHNFSVLRMDLDFFRDDTGRIWLFYISKIAVKNNLYSKFDKKLAGIKLRGLKIINSIKQKMRNEYLYFTEEEYKNLQQKYRDDLALKKQIKEAIKNDFVDRNEHKNKLKHLEQLRNVIQMKKSQLNTFRPDSSKVSTLEKETNMLRDMTKLNRRKLKSQINTNLLEKAIGKYYEQMKLKYKVVNPPQDQSLTSKATVDHLLEIPIISNRTQEEQVAIEHQVLRELRPHLYFDNHTRLEDIIDHENHIKDLGPKDDRIIKYLERKYGKQKRANTFSQIQRNTSKSDIKSQEKHLKVLGDSHQIYKQLIKRERKSMGPQEIKQKMEKQNECYTALDKNIMVMASQSYPETLNKYLQIQEEQEIILPPPKSENIGHRSNIFEFGASRNILKTQSNFRGKLIHDGGDISKIPENNQRSHLSVLIRKMYQPPKAVPNLNPFEQGQIQDRPLATTKTKDGNLVLCDLSQIRSVRVSRTRNQKNRHYFDRKFSIPSQNDSIISQRCQSTQPTRFHNQSINDEFFTSHKFSEFSFGSDKRRVQQKKTQKNWNKQAFYEFRKETNPNSKEFSMQQMSEKSTKNLEQSLNTEVKESYFDEFSPMPVMVHTFNPQGSLQNSTLRMK